MKRVGLVILILVAILLLGEVALVIGYVGLSIVAWVWFKQRWLSATVTALCVSALILHSFGFKLYGRAVVVADKESLINLRQVVALEPPSRVVFKDGSGIHLPDVFFARPVDLLEGTTNYHGVFQDRFGIHSALGHDRYRQEWINVEVVNPSTNFSKASCLRKASYGCGNTWFPAMFPRRLPSHLREDMGVMLVRAGVALPTIEYVERAPRYHDPLMKALHAGYPGSLPAHHPEVIRLGHRLIERQDDFGIGAELLLQVEDVKSYPMLITEIKKRRNNKPVSVQELDLPSDFAWLLVRLDVNEAKRLMEEFRAEKEPHPFWAVQVAGLAAQNSDLSGFDYLVSVLGRPELGTEYRKSLGTQLTSSFGFLRRFNSGWGMPEQVSRLFPEWYSENRYSLRWARHPEGGSGFALASTGVFDEAYFRSMEKYVAMANSAMRQ